MVDIQYSFNLILILLSSIFIYNGLYLGLYFKVGYDNSQYGIIILCVFGAMLIYFRNKLGIYFSIESYLESLFLFSIVLLIISIIISIRSRWKI